MSHKPELLVQKKNLSEKDFHEIRALFTSWTGNKLGEEKRSLVESRIVKRLIETQLSSEEYVKRIKNDPEEKELFISALTTHKTDWFREPAHLNWLAQFAGSGKNWSSNRPLTIWSAACSSGEEVYSICLTLLDHDFSHFRVLGTDISETCLHHGLTGQYHLTQVNTQVPEKLRHQYFTPCIAEGNSKLYQVNQELQSHIKWRKFNLLESDLSSRIQFDVIFLRNVLIYFKGETITQVVRRLTSYLKDGGYLIIGLSENISNHEELGLSRIQNSIYRYDKK